MHRTCRCLHETNFQQEGYFQPPDPINRKAFSDYFCIFQAAFEKIIYAPI